MRVAGRTALVLGGAGLVGRAVCRVLLAEGVSTLLVGGLTEDEARTAAKALPTPDSGEIIPVWGNIFVRAEFASLPPGAPAAAERAALMLADDLDELSDQIYRGSHLVQLLLGTSPQAPGRAPELIVDAINTATALAYSGLYGRLERVRRLHAAQDIEGIAGEVEPLLASFATPRLVRHMQLLGQALREGPAHAYVKVGTTGTGGMGLNVPYTHGEEKPSRVLLTKTALAGAHSMLLFLLARTPGAPAVKELKPAAAITWKRIGFGPIQHRGRRLRLYDCPPGAGIQLADGEPFQLDGSGVDLAADFESVFIDTGENGLFSIAEFTAITALGQMEAVTPEEIAQLVVRELAGRTTGRDVVSALDGAIIPPSYRAGVLRSHAIAEAQRLTSSGGVPSVAFEILGPPRLSKLLFEGEFLRRSFADIEAIANASADEISIAMAQRVASDAAVRQAAISVGVPILTADGSQLLAARRDMRQHRWEEEGWTVSRRSIERLAHSDWVDLRPENGERWRSRAAAIAGERAAEAADRESGSSLDRHFAGEGFDIGEVAAWVFRNEDDGKRIMR